MGLRAQWDPRPYREAAGEGESRGRSVVERGTREHTSPSAGAPLRIGLTLSQSSWEDLKLFAVFGDGAARETDAVLFPKLFDDLLIRIRARVVLGLDDVLDHVLHAERRREEGRERDHLTGREEHKLSGGRAAHRRLVHPDPLPHLGASERTQRLHALLEEVLLAVDDDVGDAPDRLPPLVDVVDEELGARDVLADVLPLVVRHRWCGRAGASRGLQLSDKLAIDRVHAQRETARFDDLDLEVALLVPEDDHVRP